MDLELLQKAIIAWAETRLPIRAIWLTGSRAQGTHRPNSDVDLVIATAWQPMRSGEPVDLPRPHRFTAQWSQRDEWTKELGALLGIRAHIRTMGRLGSSEVSAGPKERRIILYWRSAGPVVGAGSNSAGVALHGHNRTSWLIER